MKKVVCRILAISFRLQCSITTWWRHSIEALSVLLAFRVGNPTVTSQFPNTGGFLADLWRFLAISPISFWNETALTQEAPTLKKKLRSATFLPFHKFCATFLSLSSIFWFIFYLFDFFVNILYSYLKYEIVKSHRRYFNETFYTIVHKWLYIN